MKNLFFKLLTGVVDNSQSGGSQPINEWRQPTFGQWLSAHWLEIVIVAGFIITIILLICIIRTLNSAEYKKKYDKDKDKKN